MEMTAMLISSWDCWAVRKNNVYQVLKNRITTQQYTRTYGGRACLWQEISDMENISPLGLWAIQTELLTSMGVQPVATVLCKHLPVMELTWLLGCRPSPLSYPSLEGDCEKEQLCELQQTSGVPVVRGCQEQPCFNATAMRQEIMPKFQSTASWAIFSFMAETELLIELVGKQRFLKVKTISIQHQRIGAAQSRRRSRFWRRIGNIPPRTMKLQEHTTRQQIAFEGCAVPNLYSVGGKDKSLWDQRGNKGFLERRVRFLPSKKWSIEEKVEIYLEKSDHQYWVSGLSSCPDCYPTPSMAVIKWFTSHSRGYFALGTHS